MDMRCLSHHHSECQSTIHHTRPPLEAATPHRSPSPSLSWPRHGPTPWRRRPRRAGPARRMAVAMGAAASSCWAAAGASAAAEALAEGEQQEGKGQRHRQTFSCPNRCRRRRSMPPTTGWAPRWVLRRWRRRCGRQRKGGADSGEHTKAFVKAKRNKVNPWVLISCSLCLCFLLFFFFLCFLASFLAFVFSRLLFFFVFVFGVNCHLCYLLSNRNHTIVCSNPIRFGFGLPHLINQSVHVGLRSSIHLFSFLLLIQVNEQRRFLAACALGRAGVHLRRGSPSCLIDGLMRGQEVWRPLTIKPFSRHKPPPIEPLGMMIYHVSIY